MTSSHDAYSDVKAVVNTLKDDPRVAEATRARLSSIYNDMDSDEINLGSMDMSVIAHALMVLATNKGEQSH